MLLVSQGVLSEQAIEDTIDHFCRVNRVSKRQFSQHFKSAMQEWERLSKFQFEVDFGDWSPPCQGSTNSATQA
jgi:hypothetical protein